MNRTLALALTLGAASLAPSTVRAQLVEVARPDLGTACDDLDPVALADAIDHEITILAKRSGERWKFGAFETTVGDYVQKTLKPLAELARKGGPALCAGLARFRFFRDPAGGAGKFTAYNNPLVKGSRRQHDAFQYAVYKRPGGELAKLTSGQIIDGGLAGKGLELAFLDDPVLVMRMHIEGSATVAFDDGSTVNVGTDGSNGQQYQTMHTGEAIKELKKGLPQFWAYWKKNPKYVFFKERKEVGGGRFGGLVAGRSLAIDPTTMPMGAAAWIRTDKPGIADGKLSGWYSYGRVALLQDTGAAIKGPARVDVFIGTGDYADFAAKQAARTGEIYILLSR